jgi:hypothetical protein
VYCGQELTPETTSKEHVVGRRFVPCGSLQGAWNLIVNACTACNARKADLEDDISAITLHPDAWGRYGHENSSAAQDGVRKASKAHSRKTGRPVADSAESLSFTAQMFPGLTASFNYTSPPQIDDQRAFALAKMQLMAFFYFQTYSEETRHGGYWRHGYYPVTTAQRSDWGNVLMTAFMQTIATWDPRFLAITADGFFKVITRKHPSADTWAWAVEWNHSRRLIGFFGEREPAQVVVDGLPRLPIKLVYQSDRETLAYRSEITLKEDDDILFDVPA